MTSSLRAVKFGFTSCVSPRAAFHLLFHLQLVVSIFRASLCSRSLSTSWRPKIRMAQPLEHVFSPCSARSSGSSFRNASLVPETLPSAKAADGYAADSGLCGTSQKSTVVDPDLCSLGQRLEMSLPQDKDPFVTPVRGTRLSPTASTFTPGTEPDAFRSLNSMVHFTNALSSKLGLSRILWVSLDKTSSVSEIEHCLSVRHPSSIMPLADSFLTR